MTTDAYLRMVEDAQDAMEAAQRRIDRCDGPVICECLFCGFIEAIDGPKPSTWARCPQCKEVGYLDTPTGP